MSEPSLRHPPATFTLYSTIQTHFSSTRSGSEHYQPSSPLAHPYPRHRARGKLGHVVLMGQPEPCPSRALFSSGP